MLRRPSSGSAYPISTKYWQGERGRERQGRVLGRRAQAKLAAHDETFRAPVLSEPDATLAKLQAWLMAEHDVKVSVGCLWKRLRQPGVTLKKNHCAPPSKSGSPRWEVRSWR